MTQPQPSATAAAPKSTFVTVTAWIFIIASAWTVFVSLSQLWIFGSAQGPFEAMFRDTTFTALPPSGAKFLIRHLLQLMTLALLTLSVVTLVSSVGLLRRRNWARLLFITVMTVGVCYLAAFLFRQWWTSPESQSPLAQISQAQATQEQWRSTFHAMRVFVGIQGAAVAGLLAWVIARLCSRRIQAEFKPLGGAA